MSYEQVYQLVRATGGMTIRQVAMARGITPANAAKAIRALERRRVVSPACQIVTRSARGVAATVYADSGKSVAGITDSWAQKAYLRGEFVAAHPGDYFEDLLDARVELGLPEIGGSAEWLVRRPARGTTGRHLIAIPVLRAVALRNLAEQISGLVADGHEVTILVFSSAERTLRRALDRGPEPLCGWARPAAIWREIYQVVDGAEAQAVREVLRSLRSQGPDGVASIPHFDGAPQLGTDSAIRVWALEDRLWVS